MHFTTSFSSMRRHSVHNWAQLVKKTIVTHLGFGFGLFPRPSAAVKRKMTIVTRFTTLISSLSVILKNAGVLVSLASTPNTVKLSINILAGDQSIPDIFYTDKILGSKILHQKLLKLLIIP